jgi:glucuronoarabinoxylan endo-1,4-beta-xylanase
MNYPSLIRIFHIGLVFAWLGPGANAGVTVQQNIGPGANSWPGTPLISTTSQPAMQSTVAEGLSAPTTSYGQTFTLAAGNNYTLQTVYVYVGGGVGTSDAAPVTINLYDLGAVAAPNPSPYSANNNLLGGGNGVTITYVTQAAGLLRLDFTGNDQVTLGAGHMYAFEISGVSGSNPMQWYRTTADTYDGGAAYRGRTWINGNNAREFSLAVYGVVTTNQPGPVSCTVNVADVRQRIDGFGAGVAFLNNGVVQLTEGQADQLYGTTGTQAGLTLLRVRIAPDGNNTYAMQDGQKAHARGAKILASPWSPPAALKDNNSVIHGSLRPENYGAYVNHLNDFAGYMAANGAPLSVISIQNEPDWNPDYEGCVWTAEQLRVFCRDFAGAISVPVMMPESLGFIQTLSDPALNDPLAAANVDYLGGHLYGATIKDYPLARALGKPLWMTEYLENDQTIESSVTTGRQIIDCLTVGNMSAYIWWKCIGNANGLLNDAGVPQHRSYVMAQFSRFVRPGDYRVDVPANTGPIGITAFKDAAGGRLVIVVANNTTVSVEQTFNLQGVALAAMTPYITSGTKSLEAQASVPVNGATFTYSVPPNSVVTFTGNTAVAPAITTQPQAQSVMVGSAVTFTAAANGLPAP